MLKGTLDMLILKALETAPMHGWRMASASLSSHATCFVSRPEHSTRRCIDSCKRGDARNGARRRTGGEHGITD